MKENNNQTIERIVSQASTPKIFRTGSEIEFVVLEEGQRLDNITDVSMLPPPRKKYIDVHIGLTTELSFVRYVNRALTTNTVVFADVDDSKVTAVFDYHDTPEGGPGNYNDGRAGVCRHKAVLELKHSEEWIAWTGASGKRVGHLDMANFLEEHSEDIVSMSGADLIEMCRDIQATRNVTFNRAMRENIENEVVQYNDKTDVSVRGNLRLPTHIDINIPVFYGSIPFRMRAAVRILVDDGSLKIGFNLLRIKATKIAAFEEVVNGVESMVVDIMKNHKNGDRDLDRMARSQPTFLYGSFFG